MSLKSCKPSHKCSMLSPNVSSPIDKLEVRNVTLKDSECSCINITGCVNANTGIYAVSGSATHADVKQLEASKRAANCEAETSDRTDNTPAENTVQSPANGRKVDTKEGESLVAENDVVRATPLDKQWKQLPQGRNIPNSDTDSSLQSPERNENTDNKKPCKSVMIRFKDLDVVCKSDCRNVDNPQVPVYKHLTSVCNESNIKSIVNKYNTMAVNTRTPTECKPKPVKISSKNIPHDSTSCTKKRLDPTYKQTSNKYVSSQEPADCIKKSVITYDEGIKNSLVDVKLGARQSEKCVRMNASDRLNSSSNSPSCDAMGAFSMVEDRVKITGGFEESEDENCQGNEEPIRTEQENNMDLYLLDSPSECNSVMFGSTLDSLEDAFSLEFTETDADDEFSGQEYYETVSPMSPVSGEEDNREYTGIYDDECKTMWEKIDSGRNAYMYKLHDYQNRCSTERQETESTLPDDALQNHAKQNNCGSCKDTNISVVGEDHEKRIGEICTLNEYGKNNGEEEVYNKESNVTRDIQKLRDVEDKYIESNEESGSSLDQPGSCYKSGHGSSSDLVEYIQLYAHEEIRSIESSSVYEDVFRSPMSPNSASISEEPCASRYLSDKESCSILNNENQEGFESAQEMPQSSDASVSDHSFTKLAEKSAGQPDNDGNVVKCTQTTAVLSDLEKLKFESNLSCSYSSTDLQNEFNTPHSAENCILGIPKSEFDSRNESNNNYIESVYNDESGSHELQGYCKRFGNFVDPGNLSDTRVSRDVVLEIQESHDITNANTVAGQLENKVPDISLTTAILEDSDYKLVENERDTKLHISDITSLDTDAANITHKPAISKKDSNIDCSLSQECFEGYFGSNTLLTGMNCQHDGFNNSSEEPNSIDEYHEKNYIDTKVSRPNSRSSGVSIPPLLHFDEHYFNNVEDSIDDSNDNSYILENYLKDKENNLAQIEIRNVEISCPFTENLINDAGNLLETDFSKIRKESEIDETCPSTEEDTRDTELDYATLKGFHVVKLEDVLTRSIEGDNNVDMSDSSILMGFNTVDSASTAQDDVENLPVSSDEEDNTDLEDTQTCCPEFLILRKRVRKLKRAMHRLSEQVYHEKEYLEQEVDQCRKVQPSEQSNLSLFERKLAELGRERWLGQRDALKTKCECLRRLKEADEMCAQEIGQMNEAEERLRHLRRITDVWSNTNFVMPYYDLPSLKLDSACDTNETKDKDPQDQNNCNNDPMSLPPQLLEKLKTLRDQVKANSLTGELPNEWCTGDAQTLQANICKHVNNLTTDNEFYETPKLNQATN